MDAPEQTAKDPTVAVVLSLFVPGLGHLYAGKIGTFVVFLALELFLFANDFWIALAPIHLFQAIAAGGAVKLWNSGRGLVGDQGIPPPPPAGASRRAPTPEPEAAPEPAPPPLPTPAPEPTVLDAEGFLAEIEAAWRAHRGGGASARDFADRKWRAIRAVRVHDAEEGEVLVGAARELATSGVLTEGEMGQLAARVKP